MVLDAISRLREASKAGPVLVGPVEFGLLRYLPGMGTPVGSDHFVVVIGVDDDTVTLHDPHGHPYATSPLDAFVAAWRAETVPYPSTPFTMRAGFHRVRDVGIATALRRSLPDAVLGTIGRDSAAEIADRQARLLGTVQYDLVTGDHLAAAAAAALRRLAPTYARLRAVLAHERLPPRRPGCPRQCGVFWSCSSSHRSPSRTNTRVSR